MPLTISARGEDATLKKHIRSAPISSATATGFCTVMRSAAWNTKPRSFLSGSGDHYRTRLTHTIEVAAIARTIARSLNLNEDLTETISLAHDLGHTPFGHAGERALHRIMFDYGGFDHNLQALRIVDELEVKYPEYDGINLTWEVRSGLIKHRIDHEGKRAELDGETLPLMPALEAQVADVADDLTYYGHDVDDGLDSGLITPDMLEEVELWRRVSEKAYAYGLKKGEERFAAFTVRCLIDAMVGDVIRHSNANLEKIAPESAAEVENLDVKLISFSPEFEPQTKELRDFLYHNLYFHPELKKLNELSFNRMDNMFRSICAPRTHGRDGADPASGRMESPARRRITSPA